MRRPAVSFAGMTARSGDTEAQVEVEVGADAEAERQAGRQAEVDLVLVTMRFDAADPSSLAAVLSKYVVLTRMQPGCRNVDLCASAVQPARLLVIEKWESPAAQRAHFDSEVMVDMASACNGLLASAPDIELWDAASAHDLL
jgi:quinol monooxygenase YgiN